MPDLKEYGCGALAGLIMLLILSSTAWAGAGGMEVRPEKVTITDFFSGEEMQITCTLPAGSKAVLRVRGKRIEEELMRKSHHWDLWLNSGEVDIDNAPELYIALSSDPGLLPPSDPSFPWGYDALEREAKFKGRLKQSEDMKIFKEFVELKERHGLYHLYPGGLKIRQADDGQWQGEASFHLPSRLKPGTYHVALWVIQDGAVTDRRDSTFEVQRQGLPAFLNSLAMMHGIFYGFLAVVIAMVVGMLTGLAFHRRGGQH